MAGGLFGATMPTSTPSGGSMSPKRMLKPWANMSSCPGRSRGDVLLVDQPLQVIRHEHPAWHWPSTSRVADVGDRETGLLRKRTTLLAGLDHHDVHTGVAQVERVGVALVLIADDRHALPGEGVRVASAS